LKEVVNISTFYFCNGATTDSPKGLVEVLGQIDDEVFKYHCNNDKNDFYNWLNDLDPKVAKQIKSVKTRSGMMTKLKKLVK
jgi:hypothetical protein